MKKTIAAFFLILIMAMPTLVSAGSLDIIEQRTENDVVYVPLRQAAYARGVYVEWDGANRAVHLTGENGNTFTVFVDAVGGFIEDGTTWIPYERATEIFEALAEAGEQLSLLIDIETAAYLIERLESILDADDGNHWGICLRGPVVIVDTLSRHAVANMADVDGDIFVRQGNVYVGVLPEGTLIGNTASYFGGRLWGMITWGMVESMADDIDSVVNIMLHELFHAKQPYIFEGEWWNRPNAHMDGLDARISVRLEMNALLYALNAEGEQRVEAAFDAISIRAERRRLNPGADEEENIVEMVEGTAVYTEAALARDNLADRIALVQRYMDIIMGNSMRLFGYFTGALYGLLLDELEIDWRQGLRFDSDLGELLKNGLGFSEARPIDEIDLERYGYSEIRPIEEAWVAEHLRLIQAAFDALSGPLLLLDALGEFLEVESILVLHLQDIELNSADEFDYGREDVFPLNFGERTVFYGDFLYIADVGRLEVTGGFLMLWRAMRRHGIPAYEIEVDGNRIISPNWILTLNEGYELREVGGGHFGIGSINQ